MPIDRRTTIKWMLAASAALQAPSLSFADVATRAASAGYGKDPKLTAEDVKAYAREYLTGYKRPHVVEFRTELPKSNVGKILRRELR